MKELFRLLQQMVAEGIVEDYAIGGATALVYYFEPVQTQDVDIFVAFREEPQFISLEPIYAFFKNHGAEVEEEYLVFKGIPLQFLPPYNDLVSDALAFAIEVPFDDVALRIFPLEHLMAIMVQTGRSKDKARLEEIVKSGVIFDHTKFNMLLELHGLMDTWEKLKTWINA